MPTTHHTLGTTIIPRGMVWVDEFDWHAVDKSTEYSLTGALLIDVGTKLAGQTIALDGVETEAWIDRALCQELKAWAALPGAEFALTLRGTTHTVIFDHGAGAFTAQPIWKLTDGEVTPELLYRPAFKFLKV